MEKKPNFFKRHKKLTIALVIIAVAVVVLAIYVQKQLAAFNALLEAPPEIVALEHRDLESKVTASGNFESVDPVTIGSNVQGGEVEVVYVSAGDWVETGDVLAVLKTSDLKRDIADLQTDISEAEATDKWNLSKASRDYWSMDANAPTEQLQSAKDRLDEAGAQDSAKKSRSQLKSLQEDLANASITTSISGVVTTVKTEAGKAATGDMFTVENTETLQIAATIAEYDVIKVKKGMPAHVSSNALGSQLFEGVVDFVGPVAVDTNGNFEVNVTLTSPVGELRPGMTATIDIVTESKQNIFAVPIDAVVTRSDGKTVVYAYEPSGGGATGRQVPPAGKDDGSVQITVNGSSGLTSGNASAGANYTRREIEVQTGMETDYYIEISGDGLTEGMLLLADPEGKNVVTANPLDQISSMMGPGGGAVRTETISVGGPDGPGQRGGRAVGEGE
jgi:RND family efflux transporter MFP subunit